MAQPCIKLIVLYLKQMLPQISLLCCMSLFFFSLICACEFLFFFFFFPMYFSNERHLSNNNKDFLTAKSPFAVSVATFPPLLTVSVNISFYSSINCWFPAYGHGMPDTLWLSWGIKEISQCCRMLLLPRVKEMKDVNSVLEK